MNRDALPLWNLDPFEVEIRHRVWCMGMNHIVTIASLTKFFQGSSSFLIGKSYPGDMAFLMSLFIPGNNA
jgi:hypothetical protein